MAGPLNIPRPPQGRPVIVQAGASQEGRDLAARFAEVIFTHQPSPPGGRLEIIADFGDRRLVFTEPA